MNTIGMGRAAVSKYGSVRDCPFHGTEPGTARTLKRVRIRSMRQEGRREAREALALPLRELLHPNAVHVAGGLWAASIPSRRYCGQSVAWILIDDGCAVHGGEFKTLAAAVRSLARPASSRIR